LKCLLLAIVLAVAGLALVATLNDVLIIELVTHASGHPAPGLSEVELSPETAREYHRFLSYDRSCAC